MNHSDERFQETERKRDDGSSNMQEFRRQSEDDDEPRSGDEASNVEGCLRKMRSHRRKMKRKSALDSS